MRALVNSLAPVRKLLFKLASCVICAVICTINYDAVIEIVTRRLQQLYSVSEKIFRLGHVKRRREVLSGVPWQRKRPRLAETLRQKASQQRALLGDGS